MNDPQENQAELNLYFLIKILINNFKLILLTSFIFLLIGFSFSLFIQNTYQSSSLIKLKTLSKDNLSSLNQASGLLGSFINSQDDKNNFKQILVSRDFFEKL